MSDAPGNDPVPDPLPGTGTGTGIGTGPLRVVALGGGHGLHAALSALRLLTTDLTAVVTVADDGGSSGRIRRELGVLPPGDLRMALAALAGADSVGQFWAEVYQHRFGGSGALAGHPVGNIVLTGLLETIEDPVRALEAAATALGCVGRVLPMSPVPLDLVAQVSSLDWDDPIRTRRIRGQAAIASSPGRVEDITLVPPDAPACQDAVDAVLGADVVVLGPGSWFTSVIPHLLLADLARALAETAATVIVILNLAAEPGETRGFTPAEHLRVLERYCPALDVDAVIADEWTALDGTGLAATVARLGARLVVGKIRTEDGLDHHDPVALSATIGEALWTAGVRARESGQA